MIAVRVFKAIARVKIAVRPRVASSHGRTRVRRVARLRIVAQLRKLAVPHRVASTTGLRRRALRVMVPRRKPHASTAIAARRNVASTNAARRRAASKAAGPPQLARKVSRARSRRATIAAPQRAARKARRNQNCTFAARADRR